MLQRADRARLATADDLGKARVLPGRSRTDAGQSVSAAASVRGGGPVAPIGRWPGLAFTRMDFHRMRQIIMGGCAVDAQAASALRMARSGILTRALAGNGAALADLNGPWIDRFPDRTGADLHRAGHGQAGQPDAWRTGRRSLVWPLRPHVPFPGLFQPGPQAGRLRLAQRHLRARRRLAGGGGTASQPERPGRPRRAKNASRAAGCRRSSRQAACRRGNIGWDCIFKL